MQARELDDDLIDTVLIVLSELVTNAVRHADGEWVELRLSIQPNEIVLSIWDPVDELPVQRSEYADGESESGRGLFIVDLLTEGNWATTTSPGRQGKTVTAHLKRPVT
ncbi:hypothetical protein GCM10010468_23910 [Actinocorallia longicatena]|uniref:Histidine kinase/HSP90-like ATPase domain-containing protein n=2 Tax=Actinocorallia longicatena TaxID=111803 RepID=A0ABP6Q777_9ACTN